MSDLRQRAVRGGKDTALVAVAEKLIALAQLVFLARLLNPESFGVYALAMTVVVAGMVFTSLGTERILIQRPDLDDGFVGSIWLAELLRGGLVSLSCLLLAPFYAIWMQEPDVERVLYFLAFIPLLASLQTPALIIAERELHFKRVVIFQVLTSLIQLIILTTLAYIYENVFALAIGFACMTLVRSVLSWFWFGIPHFPRFNKQDFQELFSTGKHYFVIALGGYVMTQGDNVMIGNMLGAVLLGYYVMAYQISQWPVDILSKVVGRVALPVFSRLQKEPERLNRAFDQVLQVQMLFLVPVITAIFIFAPLIIPVVLGEKYMPSVAVLQMMIFIIVGRGMSHILDPFIIGSGYVSFASKVKVFEASVFLVAVWLGIHEFGLEGAALGAGIGYVFAALVRILFVCKIAKYDMLHMFKHMFAPVVAAFCALLVVMGIDSFLELIHVLTLLIESVVFLITYVLVTLLLNPSWLSRIKEFKQSKAVQ